MYLFLHFIHVLISTTKLVYEEEVQIIASALPEIIFIIQNTIVFLCFEVRGYVNVNPLDLVYIPSLKLT